jgi:hypothetical protein
MTRRAISVQLHPELNALLQSTLDKYGIEELFVVTVREVRARLLP